MSRAGPESSGSVGLEGLGEYYRGYEGVARSLDCSEFNI